MDLIVIPAVLHVDPMRFLEYPPMMQVAMRNWVMQWIAGGQGMNTAVVASGGR